MNRYFIPGEGRREYPRSSYARLDQIEPPNLEDAKEIVLAFDAVDAKWSGFQDDELLSLEQGPAQKAKLRRFWEGRFAPPDTRETTTTDPFDNLPMYRIEITLKRNDALCEWLLENGDRWLEIELDENGHLEVDVFGGLFMEPVTARLAHKPRPALASAALQQLFDMDEWPDATEAELEAALTLRCKLEQLVMFDVGQGSAIALVCVCGQPMTYFDVGCGVYRNAKTKPQQVKFCTHEPPTVILSHWDADHWAGATLDRRLLGMTWVAPRQSISTVHTVFANDILKAGGRILIVPATLGSLRLSTIGQSLDLRRCTGTDRNGSGLALVVEDEATRRGWLLTGDAGYNYVPGPIPADLAALVVPHHGADMGSASVPPLAGPGYTRLLYSFGPGNAHGRTGIRHPTAAAVTAHGLVGWSHGAWIPPPAAMNLAGAPVLATASHITAHEQGISVGWASPPLPILRGHALHCPDVMPVVQS